MEPLPREILRDRDKNVIFHPDHQVNGCPVGAPQDINTMPERVGREVVCDNEKILTTHQHLDNQALGAVDLECRDPLANHGLRDGGDHPPGPLAPVMEPPPREILRVRDKVGTFHPDHEVNGCPVGAPQDTITVLERVGRDGVGDNAQTLNAPRNLDNQAPCAVNLDCRGPQANHGLRDGDDHPPRPLAPATEPLPREILRDRDKAGFLQDLSRLSMDGHADMVWACSLLTGVSG